MSASASMIDTLPRETAIPMDELPMVYEVSRRTKSQWEEKNPGRNPKVINSTKNTSLAVRSKFNAGGRVGSVSIQYVPGAPTIFVNDYVDVEGKIQPGLKKLYPNGELESEQYSRAVKEGIKFVDGRLFLAHFGGEDNRILREYVYHHALNQGHPSFKPNPFSHPALAFRPFNPEKKAEISLGSLEVQADGLALFFSVRTKKGDTITYDTDKLNALLGMYELGAELTGEANHQKMELLMPYVKANPAKFHEDFEKETAEVRIAIAVATKLGVLAFTSKDAKLNIGAKIDTILEFKTQKDVDRTEALTYHFLGASEGKRHYSAMTGEIEVQKIAQLSKK